MKKRRRKNISTIYFLNLPNFFSSSLYYIHKSSINFFIFSSCWMICSLNITSNCCFSSLHNWKKLHSLLEYFAHLQNMFPIFLLNLHLFSGIISPQLQFLVAVMAPAHEALLIAAIDIKLMKSTSIIWWKLLCLY